MNYKDVFVFKKNKNLDQFENFKLKYYDDYENKLEEHFYLNYFIYEYLFVIDELDVDEFLEYHYQYSNEPDKFFKILERKIKPQIEDIINGAQPSLGVVGNPAGVHLGDNFYESDGNIYKYQYDRYSMCCRIGGKSQVSKYKFRLSVISKFIEKNNEKVDTFKLKWKGGPSQMGVIFGELIEKGYLEVDYHKGNINYAKLSRDLHNVFSIQNSKTSKSLEMYLNPDNEKNQQTNRNFNKLGFSIPDLKYTK
jgi:hypothetical protein